MYVGELAEGVESSSGGVPHGQQHLGTHNRFRRERVGAALSQLRQPCAHVCSFHAKEARPCAYVGMYVHILSLALSMLGENFIPLMQQPLTNVRANM